MPFEPLATPSLQLANRIVMAPMTRSRAAEANTPNDLMAEYYAKRAAAGLIITEGTSPSPDGLGYARIPGLNPAMNAKRLPLFIALIAAATGAIAADGQTIATENGCMACHAPGAPMIGPSFAKISARYQGKADAQKLLLQSIKGGSRGQWGVMAMKPDTKLSDDDARAVVDWLLAH
jgi:cytochrome c551/c552